MAVVVDGVEAEMVVQQAGEFVIVVHLIYFYRLHVCANLTTHSLLSFPPEQKMEEEAGEEASVVEGVVTMAMVVEEADRMDWAL